MSVKAASATSVPASASFAYLVVDAGSSCDITEVEPWGRHSMSRDRVSWIFF